MASRKPWREINRRSVLSVLERVTDPEKAGRPDCFPRSESESDSERVQDAPEPTDPEAEPDEDFTREDFMRDLRKFVPKVEEDKNA